MCKRTVVNLIAAYDVDVADSVCKFSIGRHIFRLFVDELCHMKCFGPSLFRHCLIVCVYSVYFVSCTYLLLPCGKQSLLFLIVFTHI